MNWQTAQDIFPSTERGRFKPRGAMLGLTLVGLLIGAILSPAVGDTRASESGAYYCFIGASAGALFAFTALMIATRLRISLFQLMEAVAVCAILAVLWRDAVVAHEHRMMRDRQAIEALERGLPGT
jgi:hypothetical protein